MINPFPSLLTFQLFAPSLIRIALGCYFISFGLKKVKGDQEHLTGFFESLSLKPASYFIKSLAWGEILVGILLILGFLTQIAAAITAVISLVSFVVAVRNPEVQLEKPSLYALFFIISFSLLLSGAGLWAIDLPL